MKSEEKIRYIASCYGYEAQSRQLIEEMSELTQAINKKWRSDNGYIKTSTNPIYSIKEELADVYICMAQIQFLLKLGDDELHEIMEYKLNREMERLVSK